MESRLNPKSTISVRKFFGTKIEDMKLDQERLL